MRRLTTRRRSGATQLKAATPDGIDVDFENVGGEIMESVFGRLNVRARVALCGLISGYNDDAPSVSAGPRNFGNLLIQRVHLEGFIVLDHFGRAPEIVPQLAGWMAEGKLKAQETIVEGFEQLPVAINMLFDGGEHRQARGQGLTHAGASHAAPDARAAASGARPDGRPVHARSPEQNERKATPAPDLRKGQAPVVTAPTRHTLAYACECGSLSSAGPRSPVSSKPGVWCDGAETLPS